jgi:hypothetical protein
MRNCMFRVPVWRTDACCRATLNPQPSTLNPQPSTLNPQPSTLDPRSIADIVLTGDYDLETAVEVNVKVQSALYVQPPKR